VLCDNFYEPSYESGKAVRWKIERKDLEPFGIACLWDRWTDPATGELVVSFSMLTVNADEHPVMKQFHKPGDEKRTPVLVPNAQFERWLGADDAAAHAMMTWQGMPELVTSASPRGG
jgi:putative SOS response-associated peptidase YedK